MKWIVDTAGKYGIMTLIEFHQDLGSEKYCGDGIPIWMVDKAQSFIQKTFPLPLEMPYKLNSTSDRFNYQDCANKPWGDYYFSYAVGDLFHKLYHNRDHLRDRFIRYWRKVATTFRGN